MEVLALIPARSGSKGIPHKNIAGFGGKPLLAHSIDHARAARSVTRVVVSTDSEDGGRCCGRPIRISPWPQLKAACRIARSALMEKRINVGPCLRVGIFTLPD